MSESLTFANSLSRVLSAIIASAGSALLSTSALLISIRPVTGFTLARWSRA